MKKFEDLHPVFDEENEGDTIDKALKKYKKNGEEFTNCFLLSNTVNGRLKECTKNWKYKIVYLIAMKRGIIRLSQNHTVGI